MGIRQKDHLSSRKKGFIAALSAVLILIGVLATISGRGISTDYIEGEYDVTGLDMRISVSKDHSYEVEEFISVDIPEELTMITFAVPGGDLKLKDLTVEGERAKAIRKSSEKYVVIRDSDLLTAGHHRYRLMYSMLEQPDSSSERDVFSFDVLPAGWKQPVYKLHALMWFPYGFPLDNIRTYADESRIIRKTIKTEPQSRSFTLGIRGVPEDYSVRLEADLPDGYWE